jgi:hypothetical protein
MTLLLQLLQVLLLLLLPPMCFCIAPRFEEELSQLLQEEGAPSCAYDSPPLRTWRFPVAGSLGGSGMVWEEWAAEAAAQGAASPHQPLHRRHHRPASQPSVVIYDPVSDSSISATEVQLAQGLAVLQVPCQRSSSAAAFAHSDGSAGGRSAPCCCCCCRRRRRG